MQDPTRRGALELDQDPAFQRREWLAQRVGFWVMATLVVGALLGAFGGTGPLASASATSGERLRVDYARIGRLQAPSAVRFRLTPAGDGLLRIDRRYLDELQVEGITPRPREVRADGADLVHAFAVGEGQRELLVTLHVTFSGPGLLDGSASTSDGATVRFSQWIHP